MMNWWLKKGVDGFRMDVISLISKEPGLPDKEPGINGYATFNVSANGPHVHEYLQEMRQKALNNADTITEMCIRDSSSSLIYYIFCRFFYLVINANTYTIQYLSITYKTSKLRKSSFTVCPVAVHTSLSLDIVPHNRTFFTILIFIFIIFLTRTVKRIDFMKILFFQIRLKPFLSVFDFIDVFGEAEKKFALFNIIIFTFPKRDVSPIFSIFNL